MTHADSAPLAEDVQKTTVQQQLLLGELLPWDFAYQIIPAPRKLQASFEHRLLTIIHFVLLLVAGGLTSALVFLATTVSSDFATLIMVSLLIAWFGVRRARLATFLSRHPRVVVTGGIDDCYKTRYFVEFLKQLEQEAMNTTPDFEFIQSVVKGTQQTLSHVGVPKPEVCILRSEESGEYVSYYAADEDASITRGAVIADLSSIGERRVVFTLKCSLGLDSQSHQLAVVARCSKLSSADEKLIEDSVRILSSACREETTAELHAA
jgi:hypothetical protein